MEHINRASDIGISECQRQFHNLQWNCTSFKRRNTDTVFGKMSKLGTRETAYINAITSAALVQSIAKACRKSLKECGCRNRQAQLLQKPDDLDQSTEWNACGEDINYGVNFAQEFIDVKEISQLRQAQKCLNALKDPSSRSRKDESCRAFSRRKMPSGDKLMSKMAKIKMNLHNNAAGREVARSSRKLSCKCHGVSGSCSSKTCWYEIPQMSVIGQDLKKKYDTAQRMTYVRKPREASVELRPKRSSRPVGKEKLLYLQKSPDFCTKNPAKDILGTTGRECNLNSMGPDSCDKLCCGRGVIKTTKTVTEERNCHFEWCCEVKCDQVPVEIEVHSCK